MTTLKEMKKENIRELANDILRADDGYGKYSVEEINEKLFNLGLTDKDGCFLVGLTGLEKEISDKLMEEIG